MFGDPCPHPPHAGHSLPQLASLSPPQQGHRHCYVSPAHMRQGRTPEFLSRATPGSPPAFINQVSLAPGPPSFTRGRQRLFPCSVELGSGHRGHVDCFLSGRKWLQTLGGRLVAETNSFRELENGL